MVPDVLVERFNAKWRVDPKTGCWMWTASTHSKGYGQIKWPKQRWQIPAHRLSYLIHKGEIPDGLQVCHKCDTPRCVNPEHLFLGTSADNHADMVSKDRHLRGDRSPNATITEDQAKRVVQLLDEGWSQTKIAREVGISQITVSRIKRGARWKHINPSPKPPAKKKPPLTESQIRQVKAMLEAGVTGVAIARAFKVSAATVMRIKTGKRWANV